MRSPEKILFPTDFSKASEAALPYAAQLARGFDAELHILHIDELHDLADKHPSAPGRTEFLAALEEETGEMLEALLSRLDDDEGEHGLRVQRARRRGIAAAPEIIYYAQEHQIDLIVMATHGRRGVVRWVLGSVAEEVVRYTSRPVLTIPAKAEALDSTKCLVPVDFSDTSLAALEAAIQLMGAIGGAVEVLHVLESPMVPVVAEGFPEIPTPSISELLEISGKNLDEFVARVDFRNVPHSEVVVEGRPAKTIVEHAKQGGFGLLVHGAHGASGIVHLLMGSVASKVVALSPCPVLTVKHADHEEQEIAGGSATSEATAG